MISTSEAARILGVSPNTLRAWGHRYGQPKPGRTSGGHRRYDRGEILELRRKMAQGLKISSALSEMGEARRVVTTCPSCGEEIQHVRVRIE